LVIALANEEQLRDDLMQWVNDEYAPVDERIEVTRRKKVRRFDSLARVLSSQMPSISVCCAVTIDTSTFSPRLVIGANLTASVHNTAFLKELNHKLKILKNSYTEYTFGRIKLPNTIGCEQLALDLHNKLFPGRQALNAVNEPNDLAQAVYKLTDALFYDPHTFTDEEKQSFLNANATIVLLPTTTSTSVEMQINYLTMRGQIQTNEPLTSTVHPDELKFVHAEQLIALYLYEQNKIPKSTRFILGISKLCCATCSNFLESYPGIELRGHHQKQYQGVINLTNGVRTAHSSIRLGPTGADKSPFKTPLKLHERLDDIEQSIDSASRQLTNQKRIPLDLSGMLEPTSRRFLGLSGVFAPTSRRLFFDSYDESSTSDLEGIRPDF
jgi:hypothetical protein